MSKKNGVSGTFHGINLLCRNIDSLCRENEQSLDFIWNMDSKKRKYNTPSGWNANNYWSATTSTSGHANVGLHNGYVLDYNDTLNKYVALQVLFDTKSPLFSSTTTATIAENAAISTVVYDANATDNGGAVDAGITYTISGTDASLFNINSAGQVKFNTSPDFEAPADSGADNTYDITIKATDVTGNYTTQNVAIGVTDVASESLAGQSVIDLGSYGKLIAGVQVEGKWYYYWDRSGDGTSAGVDYTTHDVLDGIFKYDINGNLDTDSNTDNTYRYATLNGVKVALPTYGGVNAIATDTGFKAGTAVSNNTTTDNPTYNDLLAIWDSYNGATTGTYMAGAPSGWHANIYWSATPSTSGHANVNLNNGNVNDNNDTNNKYVALQVL